MDNPDLFQLRLALIYGLLRGEISESLLTQALYMSGMKMADVWEILNTERNAGNLYPRKSNWFFNFLRRAADRLP